MVARNWTIATIAEHFHVLPSVVARDLDEDPDQLSLRCMELLTYAQVKRAYDDAKGDPKKLKAYSKKTVARVGRHTVRKMREGQLHRTHDDENPVPNCRYCQE